MRQETLLILISPVQDTSIDKRVTTRLQIKCEQPVLTDERRMFLDERQSVKIAMAIVSIQDNRHRINKISKH